MCMAYQTWGFDHIFAPRYCYKVRNLYSSFDIREGLFIDVTGYNLRKQLINPSPPGQNGRHFADDIFRRIFENDKFCILIKFSLTFVPGGPINNNPALV